MFQFVYRYEEDYSHEAPFPKKKLFRIKHLMLVFTDVAIQEWGLDNVDSEIEADPNQRDCECVPWESEEDWEY